jgi:hypothetical protein
MIYMQRMVQGRVFFFLNSVISRIWQHFLKRKIVEFTLGKQNFQVSIIIEKQDLVQGE